MKTLSFLVFFFAWHVQGFPSKRIALKIDVLEDRNIYCLWARPCVFQPGNFTGMGSEGVKQNMFGPGTVMPTYYAHLNTYNQ